MTRAAQGHVGRSGLSVSPIALGTYVLDGAMAAGNQPLGYADVDPAEALTAVRRGIDLGANQIDTADAYGAGRSERYLSGVLADHPEVNTR